MDIKDKNLVKSLKKIESQKDQAKALLEILREIPEGEVKLYPEELRRVLCELGLPVFSNAVRKRLRDMEEAPFSLPKVEDAMYYGFMLKHEAIFSIYGEWDEQMESRCLEWGFQRMAFFTTSHHVV